MLPDRIISTARQYVVCLLTVLATIVIILVQAKTPPPVSAQSSENNTAVFSGQFIPAFIGSAYDPSEAYRRMAGLPVYVFAYDSWEGGAFIINNVAVRTQIRADGSFQAQGLPNGQKFGVYFPYRLANPGIPTSAVQRSDCITVNATSTDATDPCAEDKLPKMGSDSDFRMPSLSNADQIQDVFSYNLADAVSLNNINTQIEVAPGVFEKVTLGLTFLTQETRVDIENNINTFPLVPTSAIRVNVDGGLVTQGLGTDEAFEVYAQRVVFEPPVTSTNMDPVSTPVIKGRTTYPQVINVTASTTDYSNRIFQAYAPPGVYAVTVWLNDGGITYNTYVGNVNSSFSGFSVSNVPINSSAVVSYTSNKQDWSDALNLTGTTVPRRNAFTVWGRTIGTDGRIYRPIFPIEIQTESGRTMHAKKHGDASGNCLDETWNFVRRACGGDSSIPNQDLVLNSYGIYAFYSEYFSATDTSLPQVDRFGVHYAENNGTVDPAPRWTDTEIYSNQGPIQVDLVGAPEINSGVLAEITLDPAGSTVITDRPNNLGTRAVIRPFDLSTQVFVDPVPAFGRVYNADHLGRIHIPASHLTAGHDYKIIFSNPLVDPTVSGELVQDFTFSGAGLTTITATLPLSHFDNKIDNSYKLLGFIPTNFLLPDAKQASAATLIAELPIEVHDASVWESITVKGTSGNILFTKNQDELKANSLSRPFTIRLNLPYLSEEECDNYAGLEEDETCKLFLEEANTFDIQIVADSNAFTKRFITELPPGSTTALVKDPAWTFSTKDPCNPDSGTTASGTDPVVQNAFTSPLGFWAQVKENFRAQNPSLARLSETASVAMSEEGFVGAVQAVVVGMGCEVTAAVTPLVGSALVFVKDLLILEPLTTNTGVIDAWNTMRSIANIFFVFILIVIGINHSLGYDRQNWSANVLLPELLKAIILANLSLLIVQGILDFNNVMTNWIFALMAEILNSNGISAGAIGTTSSVGASAAVLYFLGQLFAVFLTVGLPAAVGSGGFALLVIIPILAGAIIFLFSLVVILLGILFGRYLIIWLGVVIAPVALAISVLPWFRKLQSMWWSLILPIAFTQTVMSAIIFVGVLLMTRDNMGDNILTQIGTFLIGGGLLYASIKSPKYTATIIGSGLGSQLLGGITDVANKAGASIQGVAGRVAAKGAPGAIQNTLLRRQAEQAEYDVRFANEEGDSFGTRARKAAARSSVFRPFVRNEVNVQRERKAITKQAEKAAQAGAAPLPTSAAKASEDIETARFQGIIQKQNKITPVQFKAQEEASISYANDEETKFNFAQTRSDGSVQQITSTIPELIRSNLNKHGVSAADQKQIFKKAGKDRIKELRKVSPEAYADLHATVSTGVKNNVQGRQNVPVVDSQGVAVQDPNTGRQKVENVGSSYDFLRRGYQRQRDVVGSQKVELEVPSRGD